MAVFNFEGAGRSGCGRFLIFVAIGLLSCLLFTPSALCEDSENIPAKAEETKEGQNINFSADNLAADSESIELIGNARMERGASVITADRIKFFLGETKEEGEKKPEQKRSFEKMVATGKVRIRYAGENAGSEEDVYTVEAEKADYTTASQVLVLSGGKPIVRQGASYLSGPEIIFYRAEGRIKINGNEDGGVEGEIFSSGVVFE